MFESYIGTGRHHTGAHKLGGGIGGLAPQDHRQSLKPNGEHARQDADMIGVEREVITDCADGITDVDAGNAA